MKKRAFVTGGTGFLGQNLVAELLRQGWAVTALVRSPEKAGLLALPGVELVRGDLESREHLEIVLPAEVDAVFHVAANISMWKGDAARIHADNVDGTRNLVAASLARRARRFVFTSTAAVWGLDHDEFDEDSEQRGGTTENPYVLSKMEAEALVLAAVDRGLPAVVVNPGHIVGAHDEAGWARAFTDVREGRMTRVPPGVGTWCHARALARAHIAAADRGTVGRRYLVGGTVASYRDAASTIAGLIGAAPPKGFAPPALVGAVAHVSAFRSRLTKKPPEMSPALARILCGRLVFRSTRAERELGYEPASLEAMFADSHAWLASHGRI